MEKRIKEKLLGKRILFATFPFDGHFSPLTGLARFLALSGCDVRWYTSSIYKNKIERLGISFLPFVYAPEINNVNFREVYPEREQITDLGEKASFDLTNAFVKMAPGALKDLQQIEQDFPFDIIIADSAFCVIPFIKSKLNKPVIAIGIMPLATESVDLGPYGPGLLPPTNEQQRKEYAELKDLFQNVIFKEAIDTLSTLLEEHRIPHKKSPVFDFIIRHADLCLQIGTPSFEYKRNDLGNNIRFIGSLLPYSAPKNQKTWFDDRLNRYQKVVLVTQGTVEKDTSKLLEPSLEALKNSDILVIATTGGHETHSLKKKFPYDNIIIEDFIPFAEIMGHASVYITNGGYGGTLLSIKHRLPMVAAGLHEGKAEICSRVGYFGCGINLNSESPSPEMIRAAVTTVIHNDVYKENISRLAEELETYHAEELCAQYVIELLEKKQTVTLPTGEFGDIDHSNTE